MKKILTKTELRKLLRVPTSYEQAWKIKVRNEALLDALYRGKDHHGCVGCPHCLFCRTCAWQKYSKKPRGRTSIFGPCFYATFGGVTYEDISNNGLTYGPMQEFIDSTDKIEPKYQDKIERFLLGHIEWANAIIAKYEKEKE
jgi:hypothetical protein